MNRLKTFITIGLSIFSLSSFSQQDTLYLSDSTMITYFMEDGRLKGPYASYYPNGQLKAKGMMMNGIRLMDWIFYEASGKPVGQRVYQNPLAYKNGSSKSMNLMAGIDTLSYKIQRNEENLIELPEIEESDVLWSKRLWRTLPLENNNPMLWNGQFYEAILKGLHEKTITPYEPGDDMFTTKADPLKIKEIRSRDIDGYLIKEDAFYNKKLNVMEYRIIGIAPLQNDKPLYWVYYPELRKQLALEPANQPSFPFEVQNADDLFFLRDFSSNITKESNEKDLALSELHEDESKRAEAALRITFDVYNAEENLIIQSMTKR